MSELGDRARDAVSDMREGLDSAKRLVERTRSLLRGEAPYDENELRMSERPGEGTSLADPA